MTAQSIQEESNKAELLLNDCRHRKHFTLKHRRNIKIWLSQFLDTVDDNESFKPSIVRMQQVIERNGVVRMYLSQMLEESDGETRGEMFGRIKSIDHLLKVLNRIISSAPIYSPDPELTSAYTFPMSSLFTEMMATDAGENAFRNEEFNNAMTGVLQEWCDYLDSEESRSVLNETKNGWLSESAQQYTDLKDFVIPDKNAPHFGFESYNAFFHREIRPELRPLPATDDPNVITSPNDGTLYQVATNIQRTTEFWAKGQTYSLLNILNNNKQYTEAFEGGDIVQTFLSGNNYHRFHSPVNGTVEHIEIVQGLTFSQRSSEKEPGAGTESLGYEAAVNTRGIIYIRSDNESVGLVCVIPIGITEISSIRFNESLKAGDKVKKGEEIGRFSYGGSTLCILFQKDVIEKYEFTSTGTSTGDQQKNLDQVVFVNAAMATVK